MTTSETTYAGFVAIIGKPNVGKSTLLNTMLGIKVAPISAKPQTTRRGVRGIFTLDNRQVIFVDTPGLHRAKDALGTFMNREVRNATDGVDAVLWVVDTRRPPADEDKDVVQLLGNLKNVPVFMVANKTDVAKYPDEAIDLYKALYNPKRVYPLSALNNPQAVYTLRDDLLGLMPEAPFYFPTDIRSDQTREQWVSELIRESAMGALYQELPYAVAVKVNEWRNAKKKKDQPAYIQADIWVESANHRMIVLGKQGKMIKEIGQTARKQLELFMQQKIFLDLQVVVHSNWREDSEALRELGYEN
jgi:GTP-binding protein Era